MNGDDPPECQRCGGPRTPGSRLCPDCEDLEALAVEMNPHAPAPAFSPARGDPSR